MNFVCFFSQVELQQDGAVDSQQSTEAQSDDVYDYSNKNDVDNFCPDVSGTS